MTDDLQSLAIRMHQDESNARLSEHALTRRQAIKVLVSAGVAAGPAVDVGSGTHVSLIAEIQPRRGENALG